MHCLVTMWWKLLLLTIYLVCLFVLSRILEAVAYYEGGYLASRLLDPVSLSVRKLKTLLDQRGVSYAGVVEKQELTDLIDASGDVSEGELEVATATEDDTTSTNFTCGSHFYEEVEDTKDSVWLVQVVPRSEVTLMRRDDWTTVIRKVSRFGVRTGIFDCSLDWQLCHRKKWFTPRLILALPQGHRHKDNVILHSYTGATKTQAVFDWVNLNLFSRTKQIYSYKELRKEWFAYEKIKNGTPMVRVVLFSKMKIPAMFFSALSVKFTGRVKFGTVNTNSIEGKNILKNLGYKKVPRYMIITPDRNITYGEQTGQYLNYKSMELLFRTLQPEANDLFLLSLLLINVACWLELFIIQGGVFHRVGSLVWCIGKWNCIFLLLWLPLVGLFQLSCMEIITDYFLRITRLVATTEIAAQFRYDLLHHSNYMFLLSTFLVYGIIVGIIEFRRTGGQRPDSNNNESDWRSVGWDGYYMNYLFRPISLSLTRPMNTQDLDLEVGMELLIERLAVPSFWLSPMISSDYVEDLPVWNYAEVAVVDSDSESSRVDSDADSSYSSPSGNGGYCKTEAPYMFVCEKCRVLQRGPDRRSLRELADSESACAKYVMDGDYTCMCPGADGSHSHDAEGWHSDDEVIRKPNRSRHRTLSSDNLRSYDNHDSTSPTSAHQSSANHNGRRTASETSKSTYSDHKSKSNRNMAAAISCMPPGILPCSECVICLELYSYGVLLCGLPCGHSFHQQCIMGWLSRDNHCCPVCRWPTYKAKPCSLHLHSE